MDILEELPNGVEGWNAIMTTNFEKLEAGLLHCINDIDSKTADIQIKGSGNDDSSNALDVKNSDGDLALRVRNDSKVGIGVSAPTESLDVYGSINVSTSLKINSVKILDVQQSAISDVSLTTTETSGSSYTSNEQDMLTHLKADVDSLKTQLNLALTMLRTHGLIASS